MESLFDIFGDRLTRRAVKNIPRQPLSNIENMGKMVSSGPFKPNEPMKKIGEAKKSFLSNTGQALQTTPLRQAFSPKAINVGHFIYNDDANNKDEDDLIKDLKFTKPSSKCNNYQKDLLDFLPMPKLKIANPHSPPSTPPPIIGRHNTEFDCSYQDEFFTDDFSNDSIPDDDLGLPEIY